MAARVARERDGPVPRPFTISVEDTVLTDLRRRLDATRWPDDTPGAGWAFGTDLQYLKSLIAYWRSDYDWRAQEAALNAFRHFTVAIDGIDVHFIHEPG